jgi:hypothetical protein
MLITFCTYAVHSSNNTPIKFVKKIAILVLSWKYSTIISRHYFPPFHHQLFFSHAVYKKRWSSDSSVGRFLYTADESVRSKPACPAAGPGHPTEHRAAH